MAGSTTRAKVVQGPAPNARATTRSWWSTDRSPVRTARTIGKNPSRKPKAIFDAGPRPKKSIREGYQTTLGIA
jgi:hypothetical protein